MRILTIYLSLLLILAACGGDNQQEVDLPTRAEVVDVPTVMPATATDIVLSPTQTNTEAPPVEMLTSTATIVTTEERATFPATLTVTASMTITDTPSPTPTIAPTPTYAPPQQSGILSLARTAAHTTVLPPTYYPTRNPSDVNSGPSTMPPPFNIVSPTPAAAVIPTTAPIVQCTVVAPGGFGTLMTNDPTLSGQIGCPTSGNVIALSGATQQFERGFMAWVGETPGIIYVFFNDGTFQRFDDTFDPTIDPESGGQTPPAGFIEPVRGFGKVWRNNGLVQSGLGWALAAEQGTSATVLEFTQGRMIYFGNRTDIIVLTYQGSITLGTWRNVTGMY